MDTKIFNKLNQLKKEIDFHDNKYHLEDNPQISDFEYDNLCREYDTLINENPGFKFLERKSVGSQTSHRGVLFTCRSYGRADCAADKLTKILVRISRKSLE